MSEASDTGAQAGNCEPILDAIDDYLTGEVIDAVEYWVRKHDQPMLPEERRLHRAMSSLTDYRTARSESA